MSKNPLKSRGLGRGSKVGNNISSQARYDHFDIAPYLFVPIYYIGAGAECQENYCRSRKKDIDIFRKCDIISITVVFCLGQ